MLKMVTEVQFTVQINTQMFLKLYQLNRVIIKVQWRCDVFFILRKKNNLLLLFVGIRVKSHFPSACPRIHFTIQISCWQIYIIDYRDIVCKKPGICLKLSKILFLWIKSKNGPKIDLCGPPDSILDHEESWSFNTSLCFLSFKKSVRVLKRLPDIPFIF